MEAVAAFQRAAAHSGLFDVTVNAEKRAAILARMAKDNGPSWRPTGAPPADVRAFATVESMRSLLIPAWVLDT